jgi:hypothetical protein
LAFGTFQGQLYSTLASVHVSVPFTRNSTRLMPTSSLAVARMVTVLPFLTDAPWAGLVRLTTGGVVSEGTSGIVLLTSFE